MRALLLFALLRERVRVEAAGVVCAMRFSLALTFLSSTALAWPVDVYVDAKVGEEKFQKAVGTQWVDVEFSPVAAVEVLPGDEVLITGKTNGLTKLLLYGEGRMGVWELEACGDRSAKEPPMRDQTSRRRCMTVDAVRRVLNSRSREELMAGVTKSCAGLRIDPASATDKLVVDVRTEPCRKALLPLFKTDAFHSREITLTFDIAVLQSQLREIQTAIDAAIGPKRVEALYAGGSLRLKGSLTMAEHRKVLWTVFDNAVGRVTLEDRLVLTDKPAADAGAAAPK